MCHDASPGPGPVTGSYDGFSDSFAPPSGTRAGDLPWPPLSRKGFPSLEYLGLQAICLPALLPALGLRALADGVGGP